MKKLDPRVAIDRRRLLKILGMSGAVPGFLWAARAMPADSVAEPGEEVEQVPEAPAEEPEISEEARQLGEIAGRRYGRYLDEEQFEGLVEDINWNVRGAESIRKVVLTNADEPDFLFRAKP